MNNITCLHGILKNKTINNIFKYYCECNNKYYGIECEYYDNTIIILCLLFLLLILIIIVCFIYRKIMRN